MGREQELIDAGRTGNLAVIEKIFSQRGKKSAALVSQITGAFASLRRFPNINCQDTNGDTALHLAALNGHGEVVQALLKYEASANLVDNRGCLPLHLAAWSGHHAICQDLLTLGPSFSRPDTQNHEGETALLCAAQYGYTQVVNVLLNRGSDSGLRNHRGESPLDLACQYGRLDTVRLLLTKCPHLVSERSENSSALHLAARNGHLQIVQLLVHCGFNINTQTDAGSALHEAAVYGKEDVVAYLLGHGIDVYLKDGGDRNALEVLSDQKSQKSLNIGTAILDHLERLGLSPTKPRPASSLNFAFDSHQRPVSELYATPNKLEHPGRHRDKESITSECSTTSSIAGSSPPLPARHYNRPISDPIYDVPRPLPPDPHPVPPAKSEGALNTPQGSPGSFESSSPSGRSPHAKHDKPKKPPRKRKTIRTPPPTNPQGFFASNLADAPHQGSPGANTSFDSITSESPSTALPDIREDAIETSRGTSEDHVTDAIFEMDDNGEDDVHSRGNNCAKSIINEPVNTHGHGVLQSQYLTMPATTTVSRDNEGNNGARNNQHSNKSNRLHLDVMASSVTASRESASSTNTVVFTREKVAEDNLPDHVYDNNVSVLRQKAHDNHVTKDASQRDSKGSNRSSRPDSLEFSAESGPGTSEQPLSPTGYKQPPTPDFPPPSPTTAALGIEKKIEPLKAQEKRRSQELEATKRNSKDMETITEQVYMADPPAIHSPLVESPKPETKEQLSQKCASADDLKSQRDLETEERLSILRKKSRGQSRSEDMIVSCYQEDPYIGLTKGAIPAGERRIKSQIYDNLFVHPVAKLKKRLSTPGAAPMNFDPTKFDTVPESADTERSNVMGDVDHAEKEQEPGEKMCEQNQSTSCDKNVMKTSDTVASSNESAQIQSALETNKPAHEQNHQNAIPDKNHEIEGGHSQNLDAKSQEVCDSTKTNHVSHSKAPADTRINQSHDDTEPIGSHVIESRDVNRQQEARVTSLDDSDEWAQIAGIMASFGGSIARESVFVQDYEAKFTQMLSESGAMQSVGDWLDSLGLPQYENILIPNGFDHMEFMGGDVLEENDLLQMGIGDVTHRQTVLQASAELPRVKYIGEKPVPGSVAEWLETLDLSSYTPSFLQRGYTSIHKLTNNVWELELNSVMDMVSTGHRKRILASLRRPQAPVCGEVQPRCSAEEEPPAPTHCKVGKRYMNVPDEDDSVFKDYTLRNKHSARPGEQDVSALDIRPPAVNSSITQWRHRPEVLIRGCCNYVSQYLGSTHVQNLVGLESTKESITKMKNSTSGIGKIPSIILSISYKGVKFIDGRSKRVVCEHEISNIFCACQDGDHLNYFAYITKDLQTEKHYCHVFSVHNTELATEIILTLGEAFEVAYQMALKEQQHQTLPRQPPPAPPQPKQEHNHPQQQPPPQPKQQHDHPQQQPPPQPKQQENHPQQPPPPQPKQKHDHPQQQQSQPKQEQNHPPQQPVPPQQRQEHTQQPQQAPPQQQHKPQQRQTNPQQPPHRPHPVLPPKPCLGSAPKPPTESNA